HVLAVSGLHVGFISLIFIFLFQRLNIFLKYSFTIIGLILFMILTNAPPSVVRATIMGIIIILSLMSGRRYNSFNAIALAAFAILLINPDELFNSGFQLSFAAVISILIFYPVLRNSIQQLKIKSNILNNTLLFIALSLAAQIGTIPFVLIYFNKLSLISLIANLIVIPLVGIIIGLGIFTIIISFISPVLCSYYACSNELLTYIIFFVTNKFGNLNAAYLPVTNFSVIDIIAYYTSIASIIFLWKKFQSIKAKIIIVIFITCNFIIWSKLDDVNYLPDNLFSIMAIDVGQGDSYLIKFPNGKTALIDAGNANKFFDNGKRIIMPLIEYLGIKKIDYALISHVDSDHYRGLLSLIKNHKIKFIYKPPLDSLNKEDKSFEAFLNYFSIPYKYYSKNILNIGNVRIYILSDSFNYKNSNDRSGVLKIKYGNTSFLFTGDISKKAEIDYVKKYNKFLKSDLLKVSHHGSKTGTSNIFLNYVEPKYAVISAGISNMFNHPDKDVIERLTKRDIKIFRTDKEGAILFQSNGNNIQNINWKKLDNNFIF
ncbi:MAG: DNA internalization-related competence protein ComEC/Rec2, partial [Melioribacter sp.]|nr:DNA internalization-related competence protein ComEC/Rec2 [Melioribacter sp.]